MTTTELPPEVPDPGGPDPGGPDPDESGPGESGPTAPVDDEDPRIRERRIEVQRVAERRRVRMVLILAGAFVLAGLAYLAVESPALDVDRVAVTGAENVNPDDVRRAAGVERGEALLRVDTGAVAKRVAQLPWIADVRVVRDLPGTLRIDVRELDAVAYARRANGKAALLAADGRVVADVDVPPPGVVEVLGMRRPPAVNGVVSPPGAPGAVTYMPQEVARRVVAIDLSGEGVALDLDNGAEIRLGTLDDLEAKGAAALAVLREVDGTPFEYIDVRVPENPAVKEVGR